MPYIIILGACVPGFRQICSFDSETMWDLPLRSSMAHRRTGQSQSTLSRILLGCFKFPKAFLCLDLQISWEPFPIDMDPLLMPFFSEDILWSSCCWKKCCPNSQCTSKLAQNHWKVWTSVESHCAAAWKAELPYRPCSNLRETSVVELSLSCLLLAELLVVGWFKISGRF